VADPDLAARSGTLPRVLSVGTLNVWGRWADWPDRLDVLRETWPHPGPDVLMLQEVICDGHGDQAEEIAAAVGYPEWFSIEGHRVEDAREGVAILSRRPLLDAREEELPVSDPSRRVLLAEVEVDGTAVTVACGHTVASPEHIRLEQVHALLARNEDPLVLGADLNDVPAVVGPLIDAARLDDALGRDEVPTWPMCRQTFGEAWRSQIGRAPHFSLEQRRLDYLLTRGMEVLSSGVEPLRADDGVFASDHALVWASASPLRSAPGVGASRAASGRSPRS
jgi:endonuclease/exonuclease/phosphatase family metal-dependent hydrolase